MSDDLERAVSYPVSRETRERLEEFTRLISLWNPTVNLVSKTSISDMWRRHIIDSAQLLAHSNPSARSWVDLGSGGGFPGLVVAILAKEMYPELRISLVEADARKAAFLREAARATDTAATIIDKRAEVIPPQHADIVSSRALAPLITLLGFAARHVSEDGVCLFLKGGEAHREVAAARRVWSFEVDVRQSVSDSQGQVLKVSRLGHV
jgi:16S rRNA (guanine527-N7)-methyltransferase